MGARQGGPAGLPSPPLYMEQGHPIDTQVDQVDLLAVCGAPSTDFHLGHIVAEFRQSPAPVEHHHRHHAVVLTELISGASLDRRPEIVIELNVC